MQALIAAAGLVGVAALTPGPNNFVVMRIAAQSGLVRALPTIGAIVLGSLALLVLVSAGLGAAFETWPWLRFATGVAGSLYLLWLGIKLVWGSVRGGLPDAVQPPALPERSRGMFAFQLLNPKAWAMMLAATSAGVAFWSLAVLLIAIPTLCLLLWASFGALLRERLRRRTFGLWFDRVMGGALAVSAGMLLL